MKRSLSEQKKNAKDQLRFIKNSCSLFDKAKCNQIEALRISTALEILVSPRKYRGLLPSLNFTGNILSTVPKVIEPAPDKLKIIKCTNLDEMDASINREMLEEKFTLYFINSSKEWYLFAINYKNEHIRSNIKDLTKLIFPERNHQSPPLLCKWIEHLKFTFFNVTSISI